MLLIASDHVGWVLKQAILVWLTNQNIKTVDLGTYSQERIDYTDYAAMLSKKISINHKGILICGTGIGMSMMANRFIGIRAALCTSPYMAEMSVKHNNANVLCLGSRILSRPIAYKIVEVFLSTKFEGGRHQRRVKKMDKLC